MFNDVAFSQSVPSTYWITQNMHNVWEGISKEAVLMLVWSIRATE